MPALYNVERSTLKKNGEAARERRKTRRSNKICTECKKRLIAMRLSFWPTALQYK
jgi:hypothetical protein